MHTTDHNWCSEKSLKQAATYTFQKKKQQIYEELKDDEI